ncbi:MAG TPA: preprotein translocase subunit YajC [Candidatus Angelobacter sp.]
MIESTISSLLWQGGGGNAPPGGGGFLLWLPLLFIFAIFYFLLILPQQRRQKRWQQMVNELKTGDKVQTAAGIRGTIIAIKDDAVHLRVPPDNLKLEVAKSAVVSVAREDEPKK